MLSCLLNINAGYICQALSAFFSQVNYSCYFCCLLVRIANLWKTQKREKNETKSLSCAYVHILLKLLTVFFLLLSLSLNTPLAGWKMHSLLKLCSFSCNLYTLLWHFHSLKTFFLLFFLLPLWITFTFAPLTFIECLKYEWTQFNVSQINWFSLHFVLAWHTFPELAILAL